MKSVCVVLYLVKVYRCDVTYRSSYNSLVTADFAQSLLLQFVLLVIQNKKLCCRRRTARRAMSVEILSTVETSCTTNAEQIAIMKLKGYSSPTCGKQPRLVDCRIGVVNKLDRRRVVDDAIDLPWRKFLSPKFGTKFQKEVPYNTVWGRWKEASRQIPARFVQSFRYNTGLERLTDRQMNRRTEIRRQYTYRLQRESSNISHVRQTGGNLVSCE